MKKSLLCLSGLTLGVTALLAAPISPEQALKRVSGDVSPMSRINCSSAELLFTESAGEAPGVYVFDNGIGYMVVSADDQITPLLGYSEDGALPKDKELLPDGFKYWIYKLAEEVEYSRSHHVKNRIIPKSTRPERDAIGVLCATRWNQDTPYNNRCPSQGTGSNRKKTYTGCVATAMAQAMKYHNWPDSGEGGNSYNWSSETLSQDFASQKWDWQNMLNIYKEGEYTDKEAAAVATIMYSCGISVNMNYSTSGSGAVSMRIAYALGNYFKYDKSSLQFLKREYYGLIEWENIIYNSLKNDGPVIYDGQSYRGGHSFICDGYSSDGYFHFNWGWGGVSDGYFLLDALDPYSQGIGGSASNSGFNFDQDIIIGIRPDKSGQTEDIAWNGMMVCSNAPQIDTSLTYKPEDQVVFNFGDGGLVYNIGPGPIGPDALLSVILTPVNGGEPLLQPLPMGSELPVMYGWRSIGLYMPSQLPDGQYYLDFGYNIGNGWKKAQIPLYEPQGYLATAKEGKITLKQEKATTLEGGELNVVKEMVIREMQNSENSYKSSVVATNPSSVPFYSCLDAVLVGSDDNIVTVGLRAPIDFEANETKEIVYDSPWTNVPSGLKPGTYRYVLCTETATQYVGIAECEVKIVTRPSDITEILIGEGAEEAPAEYYDLQGNRIENPEKGQFVIIRRGKIVEKSVIR